MKLDLDARLHDADYDSRRRAACPACNLPVGVRFGKLNPHTVSGRPGHVEPDGVKVSVNGPDGYCRGSGAAA